jgi:3-methyladenine DNA glycosylase/8-oxoguanine DNA glycosylase
VVTVLQAAVKPRGPYSFALSARRGTDASRIVADGRLTALLEVEGGLERVQAWQVPDGTMCLRAASPEGLDRLRFVLGLEDDHSEFVRRFRDDPLLGRTIREFRGLRPLRLPTVTQALLRALCGQLIEARRARSLERRIVRAVMPGDGVLHAPPTAAALGARAPAELRSLGLHARRAATLVRLCRTLELERLATLPTDVVAERLERERGLGPWSVGVICLEGLGRTERGLVGDLGLIKLCARLRGRPAEGWETAELLEPYGEWAGLASVYLLTGFGNGLLPLPRPAIAKRAA